MTTTAIVQLTDFIIDKLEDEEERPKFKVHLRYELLAGSTMAQNLKRNVVLQKETFRILTDFNLLQSCHRGPQDMLFKKLNHRD